MATLIKIKQTWVAINIQKVGISLDCGFDMSIEGSRIDGGTLEIYSTRN